MSTPAAPNPYAEFLREVKARIQQARVQALRAVNREQIPYATELV